MSTAIIISVIAILFITLIIARSGAAVVYFNGSDLGVTLCTWLVWIAYFFIRMFFISTYDGEQILFYVAVGLSILFGLASVALSIKYNKSVLVGILVGVLKILCAVLGIAFVIGLFAEESASDEQGGHGLVGLIFVAVFVGLFGWLAKSFVNGPLVYARKNWDLPAE